MAFVGVFYLKFWQSPFTEGRDFIILIQRVILQSKNSTTQLSVISFLEILRFLSLRCYQFSDIPWPEPNLFNTWHVFEVCTIFLMKTEAITATGSVSPWLGSAHSSVRSLSTALKSQHQFKATKILDIYLVLWIFCISYIFLNEFYAR